MLLLVGDVTETRRILAEESLAELADLLQVDLSDEPITVRIGAHSSGTRCGRRSCSR